MSVVNIPPDRYRLRDAISSANSTETLAIGAGGKSSWRQPLGEDGGVQNPLLLSAHYNGTTATLNTPASPPGGTPLKLAAAKEERMPLTSGGGGAAPIYYSTKNSSM